MLAYRHMADNARDRMHRDTAEGRPRDRVESLLVAEMWGEAYQVLVNEIALDCII